MAQETSFLEAIRANPDDVPLRLVYADWLEEHGHDKRAEFLRLHTELGRRHWSEPQREICRPRGWRACTATRGIR